MALRCISEADFHGDLRDEVMALLPSCFPDQVKYAERGYLFEPPDWRWLIYKDKKLIAHSAAYRKKVFINGLANEFFGIGDVCVAEASRGKGVSKRLLEAMHEHARTEGFKYAFLFGDHRYYASRGYSPVFNVYQKSGYMNLPVSKALARPLTDEAWPAADVFIDGHLF